MALDIDVDGDAFETVAITWSQPEAAVMLSMFEFYGIPAFALGRWQASIDAPFMVAMQGIQVRVHHLALDEAIDLLGEVAARPAAVRPYVFGMPLLYRGFVWVAALMYIWALANGLGGGAVEIGDRDFILLLMLSLPGGLLMIAAPPTRTPSTFLLWKRTGAT